MDEIIIERTSKLKAFQAYLLTARPQFEDLVDVGTESQADGKAPLTKFLAGYTRSCCIIKNYKANAAQFVDLICTTTFRDVTNFALVIDFFMITLRQHVRRQ